VHFFYKKQYTCKCKPLFFDSNMPNILIVEDDKMFSLQLEAMLDSMGYCDVATATNYQQAMAYLNINHVDIIILDIVLAGQKTGIDLAQKIKPWLIPILFITAHENEEFYKQASTLPLSTYVVKPFQKYTLDSSIKGLLNLAQNNSFIRLDSHTGGLIKVSDLIYIEVDNTYSFVYTPHRKTAFKKSLTQLMKLLPMHLFLQVHRRYLVQKRYIQNLDLDKNIVTLEGNIQLPISRRMGQEIRKDIQPF
jgi:DNA-binding LytR/AlgR family response regulator